MFHLLLTAPTVTLTRSQPSSSELFRHGLIFLPSHSETFNLLLMVWCWWWCRSVSAEQCRQKHKWVLRSSPEKKINPSCLPSVENDLIFQFSANYCRWHCYSNLNWEHQVVFVIRYNLCDSFGQSIENYLCGAKVLKTIKLLQPLNFSRCALRVFYIYWVDIKKLQNYFYCLEEQNIFWNIWKLNFCYFPIKVV